MTRSTAGWSDPPLGASAGPGDESVVAPPMGPAADRYRVDARVGEGGMGEVFRAWDDWLHREVALKCVHRRLGGDAMRARLLREARVTARLDHPGIVPVLDVGDTADGRLFYTMRLIRGRTLGEALPELSRGQRARHVIEATRAVAHAHAAGVVHRDLKPSNVMVGELGETLVVDWGLARPLHEADLPGDVDWGELASPDLTRAGALVGTRRYLPPEALPGTASLAADVYALGATLVEALTGEAADGADGWRALAERVEDPILRAIARHALAEADARYPDARALLADLAAWQEDRPVAAYEEGVLHALRRFGRRHRWPLRAAAAAAGTGALVLALAAARVVGERDRAVAAEAIAEQARAEADLTLARALVAQAEDAVADHRTGEAEVLAAHALALREDPRARGVLMATVAVAGHAAPPPPCEGESLPGVAGWACVAEVGGEPILRAPDGDVPLTRSARWVPAGGGRLWVVGPDEALWLAGAAGPSHGGKGSLIEVGVGAVARYQEDHLELVRADGGVVEAAPCEGRLRAPVVAVHRGEAHALCRDGRVVRVGADGVVVERGTERVLSRDLAVTEDAWIVADPDGLVRVPRDGGPLRRLEVDVGLVRALEVDGAGRFLLVHGGDAPPTVVDLLNEQIAVRLPRTWRGAALGEDGVVRAGGERPAAFALEPGLVTRYAHGSGIATLAVSPDGAALAVGTGDGTAAVWALDRGARRFEVALGADQVAKWVAWDADGRGLWASHLGRAGPTLLDPRDGTERPTGLEPGLSCGRLVAVRGGPRCVTYGHLQAPRVAPGWMGALEPGPLFVDGASGSAEVGALLDAEGGVWRVDPEGVHPLAEVPGASRVAVDALGARFAVAAEREVRLLDAEGALVGTLGPLPVGLQDVAVHPGGGWVAASGLDEVFVWSADGARVAALPDLHGERVATVWFTEEALFTGGWDGLARRWALAPLEALPDPSAAEARWALTLDALVR